MQQVPPSSTQFTSATSLAPVESNSQAEEITRLRAQLEHAQRMATIGELTSTTTHEFNNLLMTILNYAKMGLRYSDQPSRDKAFQRILDASTRASRLTGSVLAMARNRSGQMEATDLRTIVDDCVLLLEREFRKYRVSLELNIPPDLPTVHATGNDLQRVVLNLLVNARQATPEGGLVQVSLRSDHEKQEIVLTVRDNGRGIPPETLPRIFEPYFSTKQGPDATGKGGTGVGLSSCKEVIDAHSGRIRVESAVGKGTAFMIRLPTQPPPRDEPPANARS